MKKIRKKVKTGPKPKAPTLSSETLEATFIYRVLAMAGFEGKVDYYTRHQMLDVRFGSYLFNDSHLEEIKQMEAECSFKSLLGLKSPDSVDKISRFVCQVLGLLGLEVKRTKVNINGKKYNANMIEPKSHALMMAISDRYYRKCLDLPVPSIEPEDGIAVDVAVSASVEALTAPKAQGVALKSAVSCISNEDEPLDGVDGFNPDDWIVL